MLGVGLVSGLINGMEKEWEHENYVKISASANPVASHKWKGSSRAKVLRSWTIVKAMLNLLTRSDLQTLKGFLWRRPWRPSALPATVKDSHLWWWCWLDAWLSSEPILNLSHQECAAVHTDLDQPEKSYCFLFMLPLPSKMTRSWRPAHLAVCSSIGEVVLGFLFCHRMQLTVLVNPETRFHPCQPHFPRAIFAEMVSDESSNCVMPKQGQLDLQGPRFCRHTPKKPFFFIPFGRQSMSFKKKD